MLPGWSWSRGVEGIYRWQDGVHEIDSSVGRLWNLDYYPAYMYTAVDGDFDIQVKLAVPQLSGQYPKAGILFTVTEQDHVQLILSHHDSNQIEFANCVGGISSGVSISYVDSSVFFRMQRIGAQVSGSYSQNGEGWLSTGEFSVAGVGMIGILACHGPDGTPFTAKFTDLSKEPR